MLGALHDLRFGPIQPSERGTLSVEVTYLFPPRKVRVGDLAHEIELGTEGVCVDGLQGPTLFLPQVAADEGLDAPGLFARLARKAGKPIDSKSWGRLFSADVVVVRRRETETDASGSATIAAARWLSKRIDSAGQIEFGCEPRSRTRHERGPFLHARSAIVLQALAAANAYPNLVARGRRWLRSELTRGAKGKRVRDFPERPAEIAGTFALAKLAGLDVERELQALAREKSVADDAWYAAQVVQALGSAAPRALWQRCRRDLEQRSWAPWTAMAARTLGDDATLSRAERALVDSISRSPPHTGAANVHPVPELAMTAVAIEALLPASSAAVRAAVRRGRQFLLRHQLRTGAIPAALDPRLADGAFPLSVVAPALRSDVTAHALLALLDH